MQFVVELCNFYIKIDSFRDKYFILINVLFIFENI